MPERLRNLLTYFLIALAPLLLLAALNYWNGTTSVDQTLAIMLREDVDALTAFVDRRLQEDEIDLTRTSISSEMQRLIATETQETPETSKVVSLAPSQDQSSDDRLILGPLLGKDSHFTRVAVLDLKRARSVVAEKREDQHDQITYSKTAFDAEARRDLAAVANKQRFISLDGSHLKFVVPVLEEKTQNLAGALVAELDLETLFSNVTSLFEGRVRRSGGERTAVLVVDASGLIIYHTDHVFQGQMVQQALPELSGVSRQRVPDQSGVKLVRNPGGNELLAAIGSLPRIDLSLVVLGDRSALTNDAKLRGLAGFVIALLLATLAAYSWERYTQKKARSLDRVTQDLNAIAKGELDRRIELRSSDDVRALADNINVVTEQLRAKIAREAESRQFDSFVRLSAMLTHDLKNAIEALSLTVGNMEQHFDNEQFRVDAMKSVAGATDKLRSVVARLTRPVSSLSGEHKRPAKVDLVPVLKKIVAQTAGSLTGKHTIELKLPATLFALVDPQRIEAVIENLVINAVEAMSERNGVLTVEAGVTDGGKAMFTVSDTGTGISPSFIHERLFRPFATTKKTGVGLGLYTCREIVQANGGSIGVESKEGVGTTFRVVLPSA